MAATFRATASETLAIGNFLAALNAATAETGVVIDSTFEVLIGVDTASISAVWDTDTEEYVLEDQVGGGDG